MTKLKENDSQYKIRTFGQLAVGDIFRYMETNDKERLYIKVSRENNRNVICLNDGDEGLCYQSDEVCLVTNMEYELEKE